MRAARRSELLLLYLLLIRLTFATRNYHFTSTSLLCAKLDSVRWFMCSRLHSSDAIAMPQSSYEDRLPSPAELEGKFILKVL